MPPAFAIRLVLIASMLMIGVDLLAILARFPALAVAVAGFIAWRRRHRQTVSDDFGSARTADIWELVRNGMIAEGETGGQFLGSAGYLNPPGKADGLKALLSPSLPSGLACRLFFAAFLGRKWMER